MDWYVVLQDVISGVLTAIICALGAWLVYILGFKGKDRSQSASHRKTSIYIPLRNELREIYEQPDCIDLKIKTGFIKEVISDDALYMIESNLSSSLSELISLVDEYNSINIYTVAGDILSRQFLKKYSEIFGSTTHTEIVFDEVSQEEHIIEEDDPEVRDFIHGVAYNSSDLKKIFSNREYNDLEVALDRDSPINVYIAQMFASVFHCSQDKYISAVRKKDVKAAIFGSHYTLTEYMVKDFDFYKSFDNDIKIKHKDDLLGKIRCLAVTLTEDLNLVIKKIVKKYEKE